MKHIRRLIYIILIVATAVSAAVLSLNIYVKSKASSHIAAPNDIDSKEQYDCILVLGCGVYPDGTPSPMLSDRLRQAIELYKAGAAPKIIMSGDHGKKSYDEVNIMRNYAIERGVPKEDIFMDHAGFSTYESMYRAKEIFCVKSMITVTQKYHLYRALYIAESLGISALGVASNYRPYARQSLREIREAAAICKDFALCIIKPEPTFLGEAIPVSGDGNATAD